MVDTVLNAKGAANKLGCSVTWIHKLVYKGRLKAYAYNENGVLIAREPGIPRQGQGLYFYEQDLEAYKPAVQRRPRGGKNREKQAA